MSTTRAPRQVATEGGGKFLRSSPPATPLLALARIEAWRMIRHPAWPVAALFAAWQGVEVFTVPWPGERYRAAVTVLGPLLLAISIVVASNFVRERRPVAEDTPVGRGTRAVALLLGATPLVAAIAVITAVAAAWLRISGGLDLGEEPGRTLHAHFTPPEVLQPVLLACFAVALGAALGHVLGQRLLAAIPLFVLWFMSAMGYWFFQGEVVRAFAIIQIMPMLLWAGPADAARVTFPADWLLSAPADYQDYWGRWVVSPVVSAWHDVYLAGLTLLLLAVALPGRHRRWLLLAGATSTVVGLIMQLVVQP